MTTSRETDRIDVLTPIDVAFGRLLARIGGASLNDGAACELIARTGALLSFERGLGNSCLDIASVTRLQALDGSSDVSAPNVAEWQEMLVASGVVGNGVSPTPLVMEGTRLYLRRFYAAEERLAHEITGRMHETGDHAEEPDAATVALFRRLFPVSEGVTDWQAVAAGAALRRRLLFITGGPGTGKTTVAARILALLLHRRPTLRIALAAPTGRAAARLAEAITSAATSMEISPELRGLLPTKGTTLHRLLGYAPWNDRFRYRPDNRLAEDVVIIDEASMVDVLMMDAFFGAVSPSARIIVLGDPDQLVSVETGFVLGDISRAADTVGVDHGPGLAAWFTALAGAPLPASTAATPLRDSVVQLRRSYRFEKQLGIGALALAVQRQDADSALVILADETLSDVGTVDAAVTPTQLLAPLLKHVEAYLLAQDPAAALGALADFRVLCALREGDTGVSGLNALVERWLQSRGLPVKGWYDHRPVLITANDPSTGLFNGDVGVTLTANGRTEVHFASGNGVRAFAPARLPAHVTAWAMTVHKAQGSEFGHVMLVLPDVDSRILTRELLYTGITRAKQTVTIAGSSEILRTAIGRNVTRSSGLLGRLV
ncbi:exodeoxyribonuclease V subunit alpha [Gemmatimonas sp.]|uniref:exodeoxyribonuclease V subunit alpha n=1 Tax=Gemmatimonas sp. TaxID=1962908 RepID=UPI0035670129